MVSGNTTTVADIDLENVSPEHLEMLISLSDPAPEPGPYQMDNPRSTVITAGQGDEGMPQIMKAMKSAGWSYLWRISTGERIVTNNNLLLTNLRKTLDNKPGGKAIFTTHAPGTPLSPIKRVAADAAIKYMCLLHPDHENRAYLDSIGLSGQECRKKTLPSPYQVAQHMVKKHKMELATIEKDKTDKKDKRAEDRADRNERFQREILLGRGVAEADDAADPKEAVPQMYTLECPECGETWDYDKSTRIVGYGRLRAHRKKEHGVITPKKDKTEIADAD